jgi:hypothetical protein
LISRKNIELLAIGVTILVLSISSTTQIHGSENVSWKIFKEKNGVFTIKYPSNWIPKNIGGIEGVEVNFPISMFFYYMGGGYSVAQISIIAEESIFTNATDSVDSLIATAQSSPKYKLIEPTECGKYMISGISACSVVTSNQNVKLPGKPMVNNLDIVTIDKEGIEYGISYMSTKDLFDHFLPVLEEMVGSFNVTEHILSSAE